MGRSLTGWVGACVLACVALAIVIGGGPSASAEPPATASSPTTIGSLPPDCLAHARLGGHRRVEVVLWCGVRPGRVGFSVKPGPGVRVTSAPARASVAGPGARRALRCRTAGDEVRCAGLSGGPLVARAEIEVEADRLCDPIGVATSRSEVHRIPEGCPGARPERLRTRCGYYRRLRLELGLDYDLGGDRGGLDRRISRAIANWRRGEPVARVTEAQLGMPLLPLEERRFEFREELLEKTTDALERWVPGHAADSYAGYLVDVSHGAILIRVGFTGDQEARLEAFKRQVKPFAPDHIEPFLVPPRYSLAELNRLSEQLLEEPDSPIARILVSGGVREEENRVEVGTQHVAKMKRLLLAQFGTLEPFQVVFAEPAELV